MRAWCMLFVKTFDWLSWFPCTWTVRDHHRLLLQWSMTTWLLTWLVQLWHITIWPLTWLVQLWKVPRKTPLLAYINQEFVAIKRNCLDGTPVASDCLSLAEGLGWRTAGSPLLGTPGLCWGKFHCLSLSADRPLKKAGGEWGDKDEMVRWHHRLDGHEFKQALGLCIGRPGLLQSMGLQRVGHDWVTELNWGKPDVLQSMVLQRVRHD